MSAYSVALIALIVGNLAASLSDVSVKMLAGEVSAFQYMFLRQLISLLIVLPLWLRQKKEQRALLSTSITALRAHLVLIGSGCMLVAITYLPLATANAVFYAAPILMLPLSMWLLKEKPSSTKILATLFGFCGVLIVLRPQNFHWAAGFALVTAFTLALFNILAKRIPKEQTVITTLMWTSLFSLPIAAILASINWQPMTWVQLGWIALSALLVLSYNGLAVIAYQRAAANQIALAEYSGLLFVVLFGVIWFDEIPDMLTWVGIGMIVLPLIPKTQLLKKRSKKKLINASN